MNMKKKVIQRFLISLYDKLIVAVLFSAFFFASCDEPDVQPQPEYGVVPMYGPVSTTMIENNNIEK